MTQESPVTKQEKSDVKRFNSKNVVVVIPAYNEEQSVEKVVNETYNYVDLIIVCNDGSTDKTGYILKKIKANHINNSEKMGKGVSIRALFKEAEKYNPEIIITMDADYQHDPNDIPKFIKEIKDNGTDIVIGSRFVEGSDTDISTLRLFGLVVINNLQRILLNCKIKDTQSGFRAFSRKAFFIVTEGKETGYNIESEQLFDATKHDLTLSEVPVTIRYKGLYTSKQNFILHGLQLVYFITHYFFTDLLGLRNK